MLDVIKTFENWLKNSQNEIVSEDRDWVKFNEDWNILTVKLIL